MKNGPYKARRLRRPTEDSPGRPASGRQAASLVPPAYGIDFVDRASAAAVQLKRRGPGLPEKLAAGVEALSGVSTEGVQVHYDSSKPAEVQALAYTQGSEIHIGPGQEAHLPHEAWHYAQQAQGRVRPTARVGKTAINDDSALEREADVMGARALQIAPAVSFRDPSVPTRPGGSSSGEVRQHMLRLEDQFGVRNSLYQQAFLALYQEDAKDLTPQEVQHFGLAPLLEPLIAKLLIRKDTDLCLTTRKPSGALTGAITELFVLDDIGAWKDVDKEVGREILAKREAKRFLVKVTITPGKQYPPSLGELIQVLTHELSLHGEAFIDLIDAYWQRGQYLLESEGAQHAAYKEGKNVRYDQLQNRLTATPGQTTDDFQMREGADRLFMNIKVKDAVDFDFRP